MKNLIYLSALSVLFLTACKSETKKKDTNNEVTEVVETTSVSANEATHVADIDNSVILWKGFKPTGAHDGTLHLKNGEATFKEGALSQARFEIDMNSIVNKDMPADDEYNQKLVGHLKSADFFDVEQFPLASFELVSQVTDENGQVQLTGDLTIKGITKSVTFPVTMTEEGNTTTLQSDTFNVDRTDFGIKYKSKNFFKDIKDKFINDEFEVSFKVVLQAK